MKRAGWLFLCIWGQQNDCVMFCPGQRVRAWRPKQIFISSTGSFDHSCADKAPCPLKTNPSLTPPTSPQCPRQASGHYSPLPLTALYLPKGAIPSLVLAPYLNQLTHLARQKPLTALKPSHLCPLGLFSCEGVSSFLALAQRPAGFALKSCKLRPTKAMPVAMMVGSGGEPSN